MIKLIDILNEMQVNQPQMSPLAAARKQINDYIKNGSKGDLYLEGLKIKSLGNLQSVEGDLDLYNTLIQSLGNLQSVGGYLDLRDAPIQSLGNLEYVGGNLFFNSSAQIQSLGNLQSVEGDLFLNFTPIQSFGNLRYVGGNLSLMRTPISQQYTEEEIRNMVDVKGKIYLYQ